MIIASAFMLSGCASNYRTKSVINTDEAKGMIWEKRNNWLWLTEVGSTTPQINPYTFNPSKSDANTKTGSIANSFYTKAIDAIGGSDAEKSKARIYRNEMQNAMLQAARDASKQHIARVMSDERFSNLTFGLATLGLSGGSAIAGGATGKALAAAATGTEGARALISSEVFRNTFVESIVILIERSQKEQLDAIHEKQKKAIEDYGLEESILDVREFESRGSFYHGLSLLRENIISQKNGASAGQPDRSPVILRADPLSLVAGDNNTVSATTINLKGVGFDQVDIQGVTLSSEPEGIESLKGLKFNVRGTTEQIAILLPEVKLQSNDGTKIATNLVVNMPFAAGGKSDKLVQKIEIKPKK